MDKIEIEERLTKLAVDVLSFAASIEDKKNLRFISDQLRRSGTAPALNYAEAQHAESHKDFLHKIKLVLKEVKEASMCIKIISHFLSDKSQANQILSECETFVRVFTATANSIQNKINKFAH